MRLNDLTSQVMLGSGRTALSLSLPAPFDDFLDGTEPEAAVLRAAGVLQLADVAGIILAPSAEPAPEAVPIEERAIDSVSFAAVLKRIFAEEREDLALETFDAIAERGLFLPPRSLPRALDLGKKHKDLRPAMRQIAGASGRWLAGLHEDWSYALLAGTEPTDFRVWEEGDVAQRQAFIEEQRRADPAAARELLAKAFPGESAQNRLALLEGLKPGLSQADEPFLNGLFTADRSMNVKQLAARLLAQLPQSAFAQRATARVEACLGTKRKLLSSQVTIEPPPTFDLAWKGDLIEETTTVKSLGQRAWWLVQIVQLVPLAWWEKRLSMTPSQVLAWAQKTDWKKPLFTAWQGLIHQSAAWLMAFREQKGIDSFNCANYALQLAPAEMETVLIKLLSEEDADMSCKIATLLLNHAEVPFSAALWQLMMNHLPGWMKLPDWSFRDALPLLALKMPAAELAKPFVFPPTGPFPPPAQNLNPDYAPKPDTFYTEAIAKFERLHELRRSLHQELSAFIIHNS